MTSKLDYVIKLTYDKEYKGYVADVLNLYGCMSQGKTKKEALANAKKAIKVYTFDTLHKEVAPNLLRAQIKRAGISQEKFLKEVK